MWVVHTLQFFLRFSFHIDSKKKFLGWNNYIFYFLGLWYVCFLIKGIGICLQLNNWLCQETVSPYYRFTYHCCLCVRTVFIPSLWCKSLRVKIQIHDVQEYLPCLDSIIRDKYSSVFTMYIVHTARHLFYTWHKYSLFLTYKRTVQQM
jgi:hypothetical protein